MLAVVGGSIATLGYNAMNQALRAALEDQFDSLTILMRERGRRLVDPIGAQMGVLIHDPLSSATSLEGRLARLPVLAETLRMNGTVVSVYAGYPNGDFILVRKIETDEDASRFNAPEGSRFLVQTITEQDNGDRSGAYRFYNHALHLIRYEPRDDYTYDPRQRPWYRDSQFTNVQKLSEPYVFFTTREIGITVSRRSADRGAILGLDATIVRLASEIASIRPSSGSEVAILDSEGRMIAYEDLSKVISIHGDGRIGRLHVSDLGVPVLARIAAKERLLGPARSGTIEVDGADWAYSNGPLDIGLAEPARILLAVPVHEMFAASRQIIQVQGAFVVLVLVLGIPIGWLLVRRISRPLKILAQDVRALAAFEFDEPIQVDTRIREVAELSVTIDNLRYTIQRFLEINRAIAGEEDFDALLRRLLDEIIATTDTEAGILYLTDAEGARLVPHASRTDEGHDLDFPIPDVLLSRRNNVIVRSIADENAESAAASQLELERCGLAGLPEKMAEPPQFLLAAPLYNRQKELVGVLLLVESHAMDPALVRFTEALSGSAAVSVEARQLIAAQRELFESFIQMIAGAIDAKSPYTGGHCARVPELTKMLAAAADRSDDGPFARFKLSEDDWQAIHVAAWLHDCGKVTTPEFVVDKATKLETIYDRIHEIRMRIEVMKREAEIGFLRRVLAEGGDPADDADLRRQQSELDADFAFLAECNLGGEFMSPERVERIEALSRKTWTRTLSDRLGVSHAEKARMDAVPEGSLPAEELLLSDRPEHMFARPEADKLSPDNHWGFKMDVPELLYNRGEVHNLKISRGTLTEEDRYKINEHIVQTIKMLDRLPFPKHLRNVPELAGGHHEKMDGTGYPKRLTKNDMSPVARMMAIADIFEALTAVDRPYKKGKTLSEALKIMTFMVKDQHVDPDLFDLFLTSGIYMDYALKFLSPDQIDAVDPQDYRVRAPAAE